LFNPNHFKIKGIVRVSFGSLKILTFLFAIFYTISLFPQKNINMETATFGSGCFWCSEAMFSRLEGVEEVVPGYAGGEEKNPSYELVCSGTTRYAEVINIKFDKSIISFEELLEVFWKTHNPTTSNQQGADVGPQYRSVIFYHNEEQKQNAEYFKKELEQEKIWEKPIVTEISPFTNFYAAEKYHLDYYKNNPANAYCNYVITPKVEKFEKIFSDKLKK